MHVGHQLAILRQGTHGLVFPCGGVALDVVEDPRFEHEEAAIDPATVAQWLFLEAMHLLAPHIQRTVTPGRLNGSHGRQLAMAVVEIDQGWQVHIGNAVAVSQAEGFVANVIAYPLEAPASCRILASVHQRDSPRLGMTVVDMHLVFRHVEGDIGHVQEIVGEVLLDHIALVTEANHEIVDPVVGVDFHDVPNDGLATNFDHRFRAQMRLFTDTGTQATGQDDCFHCRHTLTG
ncbi:hypothetical protein D3C80_1006370 [compost metagenome]